MELTLDKFKVYIPEVTLPDDRIWTYLQDGKNNVMRDGIDVSHNDFSELQKLNSLALMQDDKVTGIKSASSSGSAPEGISSISVAGLSVGFSGSSSVATKSGKMGYYIDYEVLLKKIRAFQNRIV